MEEMRLRVLRMDGDYAILQRIDAECETEIPLARALLPEEIEVGTQLLYADFQYQLL